MKKSVARIAAALSFGLAALLAAGPASATIARWLSLDEHLSLSQLVVRARVGSHATVVGDEGRPRTDTTVHVLETWKGKHGPGTSVIVRQLRGPQGEGFLAIPGDPELREGDEVVLFLRTDGKGLYFLTSMAQSKWDVVRADGEPVVRRSIDGMAFYVAERREVLEAPEEAPVPLSTFGDVLRELAAGGAK